MTREDLARKMGINSSAITHVVNRTKNLGDQNARRIAIALGVPQSVVFKLAGLQTNEESANEVHDDAIVRRLEHALGEMDRADRLRYLSMLEAIIASDRQSDNQVAHSHSSKKPRPA